MSLIEDKLAILSDAAKYDVSCVSSGSDRKGKPGGVGNTAAGGICHTWTADGRCISLLKVLFSNVCVYDCAYCLNRRSNDNPRATFTPEELTALTMAFYRRNYIEGLFLSSAVIKSPDHTMELLIRTLRMLRDKENFNGYIHVKAIPGASQYLIDELGTLADRMSVNIELPSQDSLSLLAPEKKRDDIISPMSYIKQRILQYKDESRSLRHVPQFAPAGQSTQLIIGASGDSDLRILNLSQALYKKYSMRRVFYSAYVPLNNDYRLPALNAPPLLREHRLYQSDWLLRFYGFTADELVDETRPHLDLRLDPKAAWALAHYDQFPVEINRADKFTLLRVPGIGTKSVERILTARRVSILDFEDLKKLGIVLKRARYFITCNGKTWGAMPGNYDVLQAALTTQEMTVTADYLMQQLSFLPDISSSLPEISPSLPNISSAPLLPRLSSVASPVILPNISPEILVEGLHGNQILPAQVDTGLPIVN